MPKFSSYDGGAPIGYACGVFPAMELAANRPGAVRAVLLWPGSRDTDGVKRLLSMLPGVYTQEAPRAIERISGKENCHAIAVFDKYRDELAEDKPHIVLHQISDMGNLGTITRACLGFGIEDIALIRPCADHFNPRSVRASMGALFGARIECFDSYDAYRARAKAHTPYYFRLQNAGDLFATEPGRLPALVFGNEGSGLPESLCNEPVGVRIPHSARIDSLNLAVAAGIGVSYFSRKMGLI